MNGIKECALNYLDDGQIKVEYINVRGWGIWVGLIIKKN
jgi:hypothetical protein